MEHEFCPRCGETDYKALPIADMVQCRGCRMIYNTELPAKLVRLQPLQSVAQRIERPFRWPVRRGILRRWFRTVAARTGSWLVTERGAASGPTQLVSATEFALRYELAANASEAEILRRQLEAINFDRSAWLACDGMVKRIAHYLHEHYAAESERGEHAGMSLDQIVIRYLERERASRA
jgi:hypothetical protein